MFYHEFFGQCVWLRSTSVQWLSVQCQWAAKCCLVAKILLRPSLSSWYETELPERSWSYVRLSARWFTTDWFHTLKLTVHLCCVWGGRTLRHRLCLPDVVCPDPPPWQIALGIESDKSCSLIKCMHVCKHLEKVDWAEMLLKLPITWCIHN